MYCIKYIWEIDAKYILLMIAISVLTSVFNVVNLSILRYITTTLMRQEIKYFLSIAGIMFALSVTIAVINGSASYLYEPLLQNRIIEKIQGDIYKKAKSFNLEEYEDERFYNLYYFVVENGKTGIINSISLTTGVLTSLLSVIGISSIILHYNILIIMCVFAGVFVSCFCSMKMKKVQYEYKIEAIPYNREINYIHRIFYLNEYIKEIVSFRNSDVFENKYRNAWSGMNDTTRKWGKRIRIKYIGIMVVDSITEIMILIYLGYGTIFGKMPLGEFIVLYTGIQQMIQQIKAAIASIPELYSNALDLEKYFEFMNMETDKGEVRVEKINQIRFENVSFSYGMDKEALHQINITFGGNNRKIALVGKNGSGKSSIIKLLMGFYSDYKGAIYINNVELEKIFKASYREQISVLYQDFRLFSMNVNQNVSMKFEPLEETVDELLKKVDVYEKIKNLPSQNETVLSKEFDNNGIYLSGGEQQKIGLARSLFKESDVLVLDEPFSSLDQFSTRKIMKEIEKTYQDRIVILITHDLYALDCMDRIYLLEDGRIIEEGTEKELLSMQGAYYQMWRKDNAKEEKGERF